MHKQLSRVATLCLSILVPVSAHAASVLRAEDTIAGLGTEVSVSGLAGRSNIDLVIESPSDEDNVLFLTTDTTGDATVFIPGKILTEAGTYSLFLGTNGKRISEVTTFEVLADTVDATVSTIRLSTSDIVVSDQEATATVTLSDHYGNPLPARPVQLVSSRPGDAIRALAPQTDTQGAQRFGIVAGTPGDIVLHAIDLLSGKVLAKRATLHASRNLDAVGGMVIAHHDEGSDYDYAPRNRLGADLLRNSFTAQVAGQPTGDLFEIILNPAKPKAGEAASLDVRAMDKDGNTLESYTGTAIICAPDDQAATLPGFEDDGCGQITFSARNLGRKLLPFSVTFQESGTQVLEMEDKAAGIRGSVTLEVQAGAGIDPSRRIEITSHPQDGKVSNRDIVLQGIGPAYADLKVTGGAIDAIGETDGNGRFEIAVVLPTNQQEFTLRVTEVNGRYDSGNLHLVFDDSGPAVQSVVFDPEKPEEGAETDVTIEAEEGVIGVSMKLGNEEILLTEMATRPGIYEGSFVAPKAGNYQPAVVAEDDVGNKTELRVALLVLPRGLPTVQNLKAEAQSNAIALAWDAVDEAEQYRVYVGRSENDFLYTLETGRNVTSATVSGLRSGDLYYFTVTALQGSRESAEKSNVASATALGLKITVTPQEQALFLEWAMDDMQLASYVLEYGTDAENLTEKRMVNSELKGFTIRDLIPGVLYSLRLTPVAINGEVRSELATTAEGTPLGSGFHPAPSDGVDVPPGPPPPPSYNGGAVTTPITGISPLALWLAGGFAAAAILFHARRRKMQRFLKVIQRTYTHGK